MRWYSMSGTFINEAFVCAVNGFYDSLQGCFAHFLCHTVDTVLKQTRSVVTLRAFPYVWFR